MCDDETCASLQTAGDHRRNAKGSQIARIINVNAGSSALKDADNRKTSSIRLEKSMHLQEDFLNFGPK
jgi:hypothetical protein